MFAAWNLSHTHTQRKKKKIPCELGPSATVGTVVTATVPFFYSIRILNLDRTQFYFKGVEYQYQDVCKFDTSERFSIESVWKVGSMKINSNIPVSW